MSKLLYSACEECIADAGKEDDELVQQLYDFIHENYEKNGYPWTYELIDNLIQERIKPVEFRNLDGIFYRAQRNGKWKNVCFSDLTESEMREKLANQSSEYLINMCVILGKTIREIGDIFDIVKK